MMKQLISLLLFLLLGVNNMLFAQIHANSNDANENVERIMYAEVPQKMNIKDKIFIRNSSPFTILQVVVAVEEDGQYNVLGSASYISPNGRAEIASFDNNKLKKLRGKKLAIKAKGVNKMLGDRATSNSTGVYGGFVGFGFASVSKEADVIHADDVNQLDPDLKVVYDFTVNLMEESHDLYIKLSPTGENGIFDF
jgi:hypothetical protein